MIVIPEICRHYLKDNRCSWLFAKNLINWLSNKNLNHGQCRWKSLNILVKRIRIAYPGYLHILNYVTHTPRRCHH